MSDKTYNAIQKIVYPAAHIMLVVGLLAMVLRVVSF